MNPGVLMKKVSALAVAIIVLQLCIGPVLCQQRQPQTGATLPAQNKAELVVQTGQGHILSVAYSPDGRYVLTGGSDSTARLWDVETGRELRRFVGHSYGINSVAYSPDGRYVLTGSVDNTARLWDAETGKELRQFVGHSSPVSSVAYSPDGRYVLTGSDDKTARLWDVETGRELRQLVGHSKWIHSVAYSPDGRYVLTGSEDKTARLWDAQSGNELRQFEGHLELVLDVMFSPDGRYVLTGGHKTARLWDAETGKELRQFVGHSYRINSVAYSPDGRYVLTGSEDKTARLWDAETGKELRQFVGHSSAINSVAYSPDGRYVLTGSEDKTARLRDAETGKELRQFVGHSYGINSVAYSPDGRYVLTGDYDKTARLWDAETGKELRQFVGHSYGINSVAYSPDGRYVLTGGHITARLWDVETGEELRQFVGHSGGIASVAYSPDGRYVLTGSFDNTARLWDMETGNELRRFEGHSELVLDVRFSPDGRYVLTGSVDNTARLWDAETGNELRRFEGHSSYVKSVAYSPDGRYVLTGSFDKTARLWDVETGKELCSLVSFRDGTWAVADPEGRFDASNGGDVEGLHWVVGNEPIALSQLKERYYEPGLLAKKLGFNKDPLRNVSAFTDVKLFPEVTYQPPAPGSTSLNIKLTNRGGGIGRVRVLVNGKEVIADARGSSPDPNASTASITVDLAAAPTFKRGQPNKIQVLAWNAEGYLSSRGSERVWTIEEEAEITPPELYAIIGGVSTYSSEAINLRYAAKDAEDMARALTLGAKRLFGAEKVHMSVLSTSGNPGTVMPTKDNFRKAFEAARKAKPEDILVVYLAGHGVAMKLSGDRDTYCYLTKEARSTDLTDPAVRETSSITSDEMVEWIKQVKALKQVMVLDTCAAGAAALKLTESRNLSSDQIRAIERLKDRTGFHVLMGAAADRVSYETSRFSQGLLTYALLEGMKGAALMREEFIDVSKLFQHAADRVPELARSIGLGGIQKPEIATPKGGASFEIGQMKREDKEAIPLAKGKPLILRPVFINPEQGYDDLELMNAVRRRLAEESLTKERGGSKEQALVYVEADELPTAVRPSGNYEVKGEEVKVIVNLIRDRERVKRFEVEGTRGDIGELAKRIVEAIAREIEGIQ